MAADGAVMSNDELVGAVWDENADPFTNSVRMTVPAAAPQARATRR